MAGMHAPTHHPLPPDWFARFRLKLRHLQLLAALDESRNLNRSAEAMGITQPAASRLLAEIEAIVGEPIFLRRPRGVEPNALGEILARRARTVLMDLARAATELNGLRSGMGGTLSIGAVTGPAVDLVGRAVEAVQSQESALQVTVEVDTSAPLVARLLEGRLDFVLARIPPEMGPEALSYREIGEEELCFLVRTGHPLLRRRALSLRDLRDFPWVMQPPGTLLRRRVDLLFMRLEVPQPERVLNTSSVLLTLASLSRGAAIGVISASVAEVFAPKGQFRRLPPLRDAPGLAVEPFGLIHLSERPLSPPARRLFAAVEALLPAPRQAPPG
jgi:DNA-binding transcriptional LysR family regulator